jgi:hypothetical protein
MRSFALRLPDTRRRKNAPTVTPRALNPQLGDRYRVTVDSYGVRVTAAMPNNPLRKMKADALYAQLGRLAASAPDLKATLLGSSAYPPLTSDQMLWLGRVQALVAEAMGLAADLEFQSIMQQFGRYRPWAAGEIMRILYRALASVEMELPAPTTGAFIPAGNTFDALKAVQRVFEMATNDILVVDPYLDEKLLTEFALLAPAKVGIRLLTDAGSHKASLLPAIKHFNKQYGQERPLTAKAATAKSLHDRLVVVDRRRAWTVGQSFNALATRAPTSFVEVDQETAALKLSAYEDIWNSAAPIPQA